VFIEASSCWRSHSGCDKDISSMETEQNTSGICVIHHRRKLQHRGRGVLDASITSSVEWMLRSGHVGEMETMAADFSLIK